jgi:hypothetical protein
VVPFGLERVFVVPAQVVSLWMVIMGVLMWRRAAETGDDNDPTQTADARRGTAIQSPSNKSLAQVAGILPIVR